MNKYYEIFKSRDTSRTPVFLWIMDNVLDDEDYPSILEIGSIRPCEHDPDLGLLGDGYSTFHWCEYLRERRTGKLTIVDINKDSIEKAKEILEPFKDVNIEFICDDGLNWVNKPDFNFIYLDGPDDIVLTDKMYKKIDRTNTTIFCDDAHFDTWNWGKCLILRTCYPNYIAFQLHNTTHEMMMYPKLTSKKFNFQGFLIVKFKQVE